MKDSVLIIFVKNPALGKAKTRLAKTIGNKKALAIYELLLARMKQIVFDLDIDIQVHYTEFIDKNDLWDNKRFDKDIQVIAGLGEKMHHAFSKVFEQGYQKACIIGSDCYDLTSELINRAFDALNDNDFVVGPSGDGGYYLLGMKQLEPQLFQNKTWSTASVYPDTIKDFQSMGSSYFSLPMISDVDVEADLGEWAKEIMES